MMVVKDTPHRWGRSPRRFLQIWKFIISQSLPWPFQFILFIIHLLVWSLMCSPSNAVTIWFYKGSHQQEIKRNLFYLWSLWYCYSLYLSSIENIIALKLKSKCSLKWKFVRKSQTALFISQKCLTHYTLKATVNYEYWPP